MNSVFIIASSTVKVLPYIASFLGLAESVSAKIDRVVSMHLHSAFVNLESAKRAEDLAISKDYLKRAKDKFIDAISIETDKYNLITAYSGLAFCQGLLGDSSNMKFNLKKAYDMFLEQVESYMRKKQLFYGSVPQIGEKPSLTSMVGHTVGGAYGFISSSKERAGLYKVLPIVNEIKKSGYIEIKDNFEL